MNKAKKQKLKEEVDLENNTRKMEELDQKEVKDKELTETLQQDMRRFDQRTEEIKEHELTENREYHNEAKKVRVEAEQQLAQVKGGQEVDISAGLEGDIERNKEKLVGMRKFMEHTQKLIESKIDLIKNIQRSIESQEEEKKGAEDKLERLKNQKREVTHKKEQKRQELEQEQEAFQNIQRELQEDKNRHHRAQNEFDSLKGDVHRVLDNRIPNPPRDPRFKKELVYGRLGSLFLLKD